MSAKALEFKKKGNDAFSAGEYEMAVDFFSQAIVLDPTNHVLYSNRSASYAQLSNYQDALTDADKCIELQPSFVKAYSRKGVALYRLNRFDEARDAYEAGLDIDPTNAACREGLDELPQPGLDGSQPPGAGLNQMFANAKEIVQTHPKLRQYASDPDFMRKVEMLQTNPMYAFGEAMSDPRMQTLLAAVMHVPEDTFAHAAEAARSGRGAGGMGDDFGSPYGAPPPSTFPGPSSGVPPPHPAAPKGPYLSTPAGRALQEKEEGNKLYKQKKFSEALTYYQRAIDLDASELTFYLNKAACLLEMGNALEKEVAALKEKEKAAGLVERVTADVLDKEEAAEKEKAKLRELARQKELERQLLKEKARQKVLREKKAEKVKVEGEIAADDSDEDEEEEAPPLLVTPPPADAEAPDLAPSWTEHAKALPSTQKERERQRLYAAAVEACEEGLAHVKEGGGQYEQVAKLYLRLGNIATKQGRLQDALQFMQKSMLEHRLDEAVRKEKELRELIKKKEEEDYLDVAKGEEARLAGNMEFSKGNFGKAIEFYTDAIRRNPKDVRVFSNRAASYSKLMNWAPAIDDCDKAIALDPKFIKAYIRKGNVQMFLKQYPQAMKTFQAAMEIDPTNMDVQQGYQQLINRIQQSQSTGEADEQQVAEAMKDPEIRSIVQDPMMQTILQDMQANPARAQTHMQNPKVAQAIMKLMAAGILKTR